MRKTSDLPKISIVIPCFNAEKFIKETLDSIVSQDYGNLEVIIMDGGSNDRTMQIIKSFAGKHKYISWTSKKDKGQLDAINRGLSKATGQVLTFINADDVYHTGALLKVGEHFSKHGVLWLAGRGNVINEAGQEVAKIATSYKNLLLSINSYSLLLVVNYLMQPSVFISRNAYKKYGPFTGNNRYILEYNIWLKLGKASMPKITNKYLSSFRLHPDSFSLKQTEQILEDDISILKKYSNNRLIYLLHFIHNKARLLFIR